LTELTSNPRTGHVRSGLFALLAAIAGCSNGPEAPSQAPSPASVVAQCPAATTSNVGINAAVAVTYSNSLDVTTVQPDSLSVQCAGEPVSGVAQADDEVLRFVPSAALPSNAECVAEVNGSGLRAVNHGSVEKSTWTFNTGSREKQEWYFTPPVEREAGDTNVNTRALYAGARPVVVKSNTNSVHISHMDDSGQIWSPPPYPHSITPYHDGFVVRFDAAYFNGRVHAAWQFGKFGTDDTDALYTRSSPDLTELSEPLYLAPEWDGQFNGPPSLAVDKNGVVNVAWGQDDGTHLAAIDDDTPQVLSARVLTTGNGPHLAGFADGKALDGLLMAWFTRSILGQYRTEVVVPNENNRVIHSADFEVERAQGLLAVGSDSGVLHGTRVEDGGFSYYLRTIDAGNETVGPLQPLLYVPSGEQYYCSELATNGAGVLAWLSATREGFGEEPYPERGTLVPMTRTIRISRDGGESFDDPIPVPFMLPTMSIPHEAGQAHDVFCPLIAVSPSGGLFLAWGRRPVESYPRSLMSTIGSPHAPCGAV